MDETLIGEMRAAEERHWWFRGRRSVLLALVEAYLAPGRRLLDVGSGTGYFLERAAARYTASGIDPSPQAVRFCQERGLRAVEGRIADAHALRDREFAAVTLFDVLEHLPDEQEALREVHQLLAPGGLLFLSVPAYQWLWSPHDVRHGHHRRYTARRLAEALNQAGFAPVAVGYFNARLLPAAVLVRLWHRLTGTGHGPDLGLPPRWLNEWMARLLAGETRRLGRPHSTGYHFGLSVFGVARATPAGSTS